MTRVCVTTVCLLIVLASTVRPAAAHHSGAMFDDKKQVTLTGTIKESSTRTRIRGSWSTSRTRTAK